jgi:hypothetical protein
MAMADDDKHFLTILLWEMRTSVLPITPKQSDRFLNELVRHPLGRKKTEIPKDLHQDHVNNFFSTFKV